MTSAFEQIKSRLPITDVLSTYITLIPAGTQFKAKCPFHNEKTASFSISPERGVYYCFGCGAKGDVFDFVEQFEGVDKKGALKILADRAGIVLAARDEEKSNDDPVYAALEDAAQRFEFQLAKYPDVLAYLKARGLTDETIKEFRIGYAPSEWRFIATSLPDSKLDDYERAGLIKKTEKGYYDRFRGRIMFPMNDTSGRIVAFSGRIFPQGNTTDAEGPKYLNSPETEVFHKSRVLYGFDKAKVYIKKHNFAILVEGQMDMVLSHQAGFKNTVATSGTAVSDAVIGDSAAQLSVLARLTPNIFLAFDGDAAGEKAVARAALVALALGLNPKVVPLPPGVDPADYISKEGTDAWKDRLKQSTHFIAYELSLVRRDAASAHALVRLMKERMFPFLARIASPIERSLHITSIARDIGIQEQEVADELAQYIRTQKIEEKIEEKVEYIKEQVSFVERFAALKHLYRNDRMNELHNSLVTTEFDGITLSFPEISQTRIDTLSALIERDYGTLDEETRGILASELVEKIRQEFFTNMLLQYTNELKIAESKNDEAETNRLLAKLHELNIRRQSP